MSALFEDLDAHAGGFALTQGEVVTADANLDRIAERGVAHDRALGADGQAHLEEALVRGGRECDAGDFCAGADGLAGEDGGG